MDEVLLRVDAGDLLVKVIKLSEKLFAILVQQFGKGVLALGELRRQLANRRAGGDGRFKGRDVNLLFITLINL